MMAGYLNVNKAFNARKDGSKGRLSLEKRIGTCVVKNLAGARGLMSQRPGNDRWFQKKCQISG